MKKLNDIFEGIFDIGNDIEELVTTKWLHKYNPEFECQCEITGDELRIKVPHKDGDFSITNGEFWNDLKKYGVKKVVCRNGILFTGSDMDIDGIEINAGDHFILSNCQTSIKNCKITCNTVRIYGGSLHLDNVEIICRHRESCIGFHELDSFSYENSSIKTTTLQIRYPKYKSGAIKNSDWGKYIESLGVMRFTASNTVDVLETDTILNYKFMPPIDGAKRYILYIPVNVNSKIIFEKNDRISYYDKLHCDCKWYFKNGWIGRYTK